MRAGRQFAGCLTRARGLFDHVAFAVLDHQRGTPALTAFARAFGLPSAR